MNLKFWLNKYKSKNLAHWTGIHAIYKREDGCKVSWVWFFHHLHSPAECWLAIPQDHRMFPHLGLSAVFLWLDGGIWGEDHWGEGSSMSHCPRGLWCRHDFLLWYVQSSLAPPSSKVPCCLVLMLSLDNEHICAGPGGTAFSRNR